MVAELLENPDGLERLGSLASEQGLDIRRCEEVVVQIKLERGQVAEHNMLVLDREVFGQNVVCAADDEFVDGGKQLGKALVAALPVSLGSIGVAATEDRKLEAFAELQAASEEVGVRKADEGEVLGQIVLDRRAGQDNAPRHV